jgi:hypothetical protein
MLIELSIVPLGCEVHWSDQLAEALKLVDASGSLPRARIWSGRCTGWASSRRHWSPIAGKRNSG